MLIKMDRNVLIHKKERLYKRSALEKSGKEAHARLVSCRSMLVSNPRPINNETFEVPKIYIEIIVLRTP